MEEPREPDQSGQPGQPGRPDLPSAAELGLSDAEYARILRDLRQRHGLGPLPRGPAATSGALPPTRPPRPFPRVVLAVVVATVVVLLRVGSFGSHDDDPAYRFLAMYGDHPVAYSSCRPLQVAVYPAGGPADAEQLVREAVTRVRAASGLDIVVIGSYGGHAPNWNFEAAPFSVGDPVSVSWQDGDAIAEMTDNVAGLGGSPVVTDPSGVRYRVAGTIALSRDYYAYLARRHDHDEAVAILMHEFGHVLGLDHVHSHHELMSDDNVGQTDFGPGDLQGLRLLGHGPCV